MTDIGDYTEWGGYEPWARLRIAELERWQKVDLENYKQHLAELTEMLTAATDVAVQRGKTIERLEIVRDLWRERAKGLEEMRADGG